MLADDLAAFAPMAEPVKARAEYPSGWTPGVTWDGATGSGQITTAPLAAPPVDWSDLLRSRGLDPDVYEVVGDTISWCSWDGWKRDAPGEDAYSAQTASYRARIRLKTSPLVGDVSAEALLKEIRNTRRKNQPKTITGDPATFVVNLSDWQVGNGDGGGVTTQLEAIAALPDLITDRVKALRKCGHGVNHVVIAGMGDLGEGVCGFYPAQQTMVQLDRREQSRVVRRGVTEIVKAVASTVPEVTVTAVAGNHGENRQGGKAITSPNDNDDVAVFEQVAEIFAESVFDNVSFRLPADRLAIALELHGHIVAWTHGHITKPGPNAAQALWNWWRDQIMGRYYACVADAVILNGAHYHHLNVKQQQGRTVLIGPSLTAVGDWYSNTAGVQTVPGTLSYLVTERGWSNLEVLA